MSVKNKFQKIALVIAIATTSTLFVNGCATLLVGGAAAGAGAFVGSDSRPVDKQYNDQKITNTVLDILKNDRTRSEYKVFRVDGVSVNGNVLLVGQTRDREYLNEAVSKIQRVEGVRRIFNQVANKEPVSAGTVAKDSLITSRVKSLLLLGDDISSGRFKVITEDGVVYLLGYVTKDEGQRAINQARKVSGVKKIHPIYDYMDASGTPNSSDGAPVVSSDGVSTTSTSTQSATRSSSLAEEAQSSVDNGGAVLEDDELLSPSSPAQSF